MLSTPSNVLDVFNKCVYVDDEVIFTMSGWNSKKAYYYRGAVVEVRKKIKVLITEAQERNEYSAGQEVWAQPYRLVVI